MQPNRSMVFVNTKRAAEEVWSYLQGNGYSAAILSGDVPQNKRQKLLAQFTAGELPVLVATDVAARGLHVPNVTHVFNFDLPQDAEDYVHRIGRTARAGESGTAVSFACEDYAFSLMDIEEYIGAKIPVSAIGEELLVKPQPPSRQDLPSERTSRHGDRGHRPPRGGDRKGGRSRRPHSRNPV
jgi:ATP-dependent RNA helicase RhlB